MGLKAWSAACVVCVLMGILSGGCQDRARVGAIAGPTTDIAVSGHYIISGGVAHPGMRPVTNQTLADVIRANESDLLVRPPMTIAYVRAGPEGRTRELIDIDATGQPIEPAKNHLLRNGDELMFPTQAATRP